MTAEERSRPEINRRVAAAEREAAREATDAD